MIMDNDPMAILDYPFQRSFPFYCIIETASCSYQVESDTEEKKSDPDLEKIFQVFDLAGDIILDGSVAHDKQ